MDTNNYSRSWKVYLLSDVCTDYTWAYNSVSAMMADDAALLKAEIEAGTRYNLVHSRQVEYFLKSYPYLADRLIESIRNGQVTLNPVRCMTNFANMSLEEIVRSFYPARRLARKYGLDDHFANIQETPTASWILPTIFANIGVKHLVRSLLPYECPWVKRLTEPPIYWWQGPDGSKILVRLRKEDYVEGMFVLKGVEAINNALRERILPDYEIDGEYPFDAGEYPFDAIALLGCYGDLSPQSKEFPAKKAVSIAAYNGQGGNHPLLVDAVYADFWADIDRQITAGAQVPVVRGDYGTSWEAWPACLAADFAGYRRAQTRATLADCLNAIVSSLVDMQDRKFPSFSSSMLLESAWDSLIALSDHAWNGSSDASRKLNAALRHNWQQEANTRFDALIAEGMQSLASCIPAREDGLLVFNHRSWPRTGTVRLTSEIPAALADPLTGEHLPVQVAADHNQLAGYCIIPEVPSVGYRVFSVISQTGETEPPFLSLQEEGDSQMTIESPFYTLTLDPETGAVASLHDKIRNVELVDPTSAYCLNEGLYTTGDALETESYTLYSLVNFDGAAENRSRLVEVKPSVSGPVFNEMKVITCVGVIQVITTYRLYHAVDRLDICNEVVKPVAPHKEQLDFAFPFHVPNRNVRIETPGVILDPETDRLPGAGLSVHAVRRFVDVFNEEYGVTLVMDDSGLVQFGHRTTAEDPLGLDPNATLLCVALGNVYDWNEAIRDQGGVTQFTFRYSIAGHAGGFDPVAAVRFGWGDEMEVIPLPAGKRRGLPFPNHSFIGISPTQTVLTGMCAAEAGGIALRLWEISGEDSGVVVDAQGLGECIEAYCIDLLETEQYSIPTQSGKILLPLPGHGLGAVRLTFKDQDNLSEG